MEKNIYLWIVHWYSFPHIVIKYKNVCQIEINIYLSSEFEGCAQPVERPFCKVGSFTKNQFSLLPLINKTLSFIDLTEQAKVYCDNSFVIAAWVGRTDGRTAATIFLHNHAKQKKEKLSRVGRLQTYTNSLSLSLPPSVFYNVFVSLLLCLFVCPRVNVSFSSSISLCLP